MTTADIRETIELAKRQEQRENRLAKLLEVYVQKEMHSVIRLPEKNPTAALLQFVIAYIENVPDFIDAAREITRTANIQDYAEPYLCLAENYFLKPAEIVAGHVTLGQLLDGAYLAHRLIEEVNDHFMIRSSIPLVPMDMTVSNLIVHSLIGEPFANELDEAVLFTAERSMSKLHVYDSDAFKAYIRSYKDNRWRDKLKEWPCLTDTLAIELQLPG